MRIAVQDWMRSPGVTAVFDALADGETRFVGGCVRDGLLGRPIRDVDIATDLEPKAVMSRAGRAGIKAVPTGIAHGTVTLVAKGEPIEVTTLRKDVETDGRRAVVAFTRDWREDALRRDFTMNALSMDRDGTVHDFFDGVQDAKSGIVRFVGDAETRIREDVLRILRFFRFHAYYGAGELDPSGYDACRALVSLLPTLSGERIRQEILRLLEANAPVPTIQRMSEIRVWREIGLSAIDADALSDFIATEGDQPDPIPRLAALLPREVDVDGVASALRLSGREASKLRTVRSLAASDPPETGDVGAFLYRNGADSARQAAGLARAWMRDPDAWAAVAKAADQWSPRVFPLRGRDLLDAGMEPGAAVGAVLEAVENWWIDNGFEPGRTQCLERARSLMASG